jgi:hypothetical protein
MYYPEFLPDVARPRGLAWSSAADRVEGCPTFGTIRYGRLAEVLLYDIRHAATRLVERGHIDLEAERWLKARMAATVLPVVHAINPPDGRRANGASGIPTFRAR